MKSTRNDRSPWAWEAPRLPGMWRRWKASRGLHPGRGKRTSVVFVALAVLASLHGPAPSLHGQNAQEILAQAMERYEQNLAGVENITVRQEVMGVETTAYMVRGTVGGHSILQPMEVDATGAEVDPLEEVGDLWASPHELYVSLADRWTMEGRGTVDGRETWLLSLSDPEALDWDMPTGPAGGFTPERVELELAVDDLVPLAMRISGQGTASGGPQSFGMQIRFSDYRTVSGYLHPFLISLETDGAAPGVSEAEMEEARRGLAELEREMENMPEAQRAMMERMMGDQIQMLREMVEGGGLQLEIRVTDLQVNAGPPGV